MKKRDLTSKLSFDKETIARLDIEQLSLDQTQEIEGGATNGGDNGPSCCGEGRTSTYTSCAN
ncbi:class I lanthipeptide [Dyadobacter crusticola]|uniref:class I lanthipeptide n=1 Tax=Dyadobacter crusticola TaxID=292407 RepID=UPI0004E2043A|nr:class I lanthipeptide [Dyadobacter crusticola]